MGENAYRTSAASIDMKSFA